MDSMDRLDSLSLAHEAFAFRCEEAMHDLLDQILKLWAAECGSKEITVKRLLARASKPLLEMFLRVASDPQDRHRIHPRLLGVFLGNNRGIPAAAWKLSDRSRNRQSLWWLEPAPFKRRPLKEIESDLKSFRCCALPSKRSYKIRLWDEVALSSHRTSPEVAKQIALAQKTFGSRLTEHDL
jgi:hypothetical protein